MSLEQLRTSVRELENAPWGNKPQKAEAAVKNVVRCFEEHEKAYSALMQRVNVLFARVDATQRRMAELEASYGE